MTDRIPLIVNSGAAQIQELPAGDNLSITGNITANYFIGNGSQLTGIASSGNVNFTAVASNIIPTGNSVYSLGNSTNQWNDLYLSNATIYMNGVPIGLTAGNVLTVNGADVVTTAANGVTALGNIGITGDAIYDLNGLIIENADLTHGATAAVILPSNGNVTIPVQLNNTYGNLLLQAGASSDVTASWTFSNNGTTQFPNNILKSQPDTRFYIDAHDIGESYAYVAIRNFDNADNVNSQITAATDSIILSTTGGQKSWQFSNSGALTIPSGNANNTAQGQIFSNNESGFINLDVQFNSDVLGGARLGTTAAAPVDIQAYNKTWRFGDSGNLTVPGNIQSISTGFAFTSGIISIDNLSPAVITVADSTFPGVVTGRVTISEVNSPLQANGTWYYESVEANQIALYLDAGLTQPVDATGWPGYAGPGGLAVSPGYSNLTVTGGNVSIVSNFGETWTFEAGGALRIPNDIVSNATIDLDNRASSNTADIRLFAADDIQLQGRDKPDDLEAEGGDINIYGGRGAAAVTSGFDTGGGGDVQIYGGPGGTDDGGGFGGSFGGFVSIRGGDGGTSVDSNAGGGGSINLTAGSAPGAATTALGGLGGGVNIIAGTTTRINESGGSIELTTGGASGDGSGAAGYVSINVPSSNVGTGGQWIFSGTGTTLNVPANAEIFGASVGNFTVGCAGNTIVTSSDYGANVKNWVFGYTGNLTLPQGGIVQETSIPSGGLTGNTIALKPSGGTNADQQLLVYPTTGQDFNHLHMTSGNLFNTELFLGDDNFFVKLANTGNIVINTYDNVSNTAQWTFDYNGTISTNDNLTLQVSDGIPTSVANWNGQGGWNQGSYIDLATTGGTGTGLTVDVAAGGGGYISINEITIHTPGTGYTNGDVITINNENNLPGTFTLIVPTPAWNFNTDSSLTLPTITLGTNLDEQTVISSQRKLIPPLRYSAVIDANNPTIVYTATNVDTTSMKVTMQVQHAGLGMEFFEVFATFTGADTFYTVNNRVSPPTIEPSTVVVGLGVGNAMKITVTVNSGAATSWVTYDAVEFGIAVD